VVIVTSKAREMDLLGTRLGRYELRERLGKGGMAVVYKGWDTNLERTVAVKVLHEYLVEDEDFRTRFEREAKIIASLDHPNIVQVYDFDVADRNGQPVYYMIMKYIPGKSLRALMEVDAKSGQRLTVPEVTNVMNGVTSALHYAHQRGMVHRDVTPGNILFDEDGRAVLADFGIARIVTSQRVTQSGTISGTPLYMSPEQGIGEAGDQRSDIYSLGVILYEMLAARPPFDAESTVALMLKHINEPVPSVLMQNSLLPPALDTVVMRALAKDASDRYETAAELMAAYETALSSTEATRRQDLNRTEPMRPMPMKSARLRGRASNNWLYPAVALIGFALLAGIGALVSGNLNRQTATPTLAVPPIRTRAFAPSMTSGPREFKEAFDAPDRAMYWPMTLDDPDIYRQVENGAYRIRHMLPAAAVTTIYFPTMSFGAPSIYTYAADFTLTADNPPDTATGIVFRFRDDDNYYVFAVNGMGQISLWSRFNGEWHELRALSSEWTDTTAAKPLGEVNHLRVVDEVDTLRCYVNDALMIELSSEPKITRGAIGIYLASSTSPVANEPFAEVVVDNYSVKVEREATVTEAVTAEATQES
jgi:serine/threonine protein kinase